MGATARFLTLFLAVGACGDDDGPADADIPRNARVELGTGATDYEELPAESDQILVAGPQGGHHFIVHARIRGLIPGDPSRPGEIGNPSTLFTVMSEDDERLDVDMAPYRLGYEEVGDDLYVLPGGRIVQVIEDEVENIIGSRVRIRVEVTDVRDVIVWDERWVNAIADPSPPDAGP